MRVRRTLSGLLALALVVLGSRVALAGNPFGVPDVKDPDGADVREFARQVRLPGDSNDPNAEQWVKEARPGKRGSLDGEWFERWHGGDGNWNYGKVARIKVVGDRVYILAHSSNGRFLVDLKREGNRLIGRYQGLDDPNDSTPVVFKVVDDERLDGQWGGPGRWDFRRKIR
jgi:hypothetical protein